MPGGEGQGVRDAETSDPASGAVPDPPAHPGGIAGLIARVLALRPVRVFFHYNGDNGPLLASGMAFQAVFALFAALWFTFSVLGIAIHNSPQLQDAIVRGVNSSIPGFLSVKHGKGTIALDDFLKTGALTLSGAISLVGVLLTAVGFLGTLRTAIRAMFGLPGPKTNPVLQKLTDLGLTIAFGAAVLLTAVVSVISTTALGAVLQFLGLSTESWLTSALSTAIGALVIAAIDSCLLAGAFRILSAVRVPRKRLWAGAVIGGVGLTVLETLGSSLLGGAKSNPLLASFVVIVGLLVYFNLVSQVILLAAAWIAVGMTDAGIDPRELSTEQLALERAEQLEQARRLVALANRRVLQDRVRAAKGTERWLLARRLKREARAEERRRKAVPTATEFTATQDATDDPTLDANQVTAERAHAEHSQPDRSVGRHR